MKLEVNVIRVRLKTPRAAAIAGILFSVLLSTGLILFRLSVRADPLEAGAWLKTSSNTVALALNLMPFAGIAFLWFIGVLRDRLGELEHRFFATVFLGSELCDNVLGPQGSKLTRNTTAQICPATTAYKLKRKYYLRSSKTRS